MTAYPLYTVWMQVVIHYQAFRLWWKQVCGVMMTIFAGNGGGGP